MTDATMRQVLKPHPDWPCGAAARIEVDVARISPGALELRFALTGAIADFRLPPAAEPARADELWRRTCFEAFVRAGEGKAYIELNFAPSRQWAVYRFNGYRTGMTAVR